MNTACSIYEYVRESISGCEEKISRFAVPRDIRFVETLPRTSVHKVDFMRLTQNSPQDNIWTSDRQKV